MECSHQGTITVPKVRIEATEQKLCV